MNKKSRKPIRRNKPSPKTAAIQRMSKVDYYLDIAQRIAARSTCLRRNYGAVIVNNDQILATGYNGAPRGTRNCIDVGQCYREMLGIKPGERYELCRGVHAEQNAIIHASRFDMLDGTMFIAGIDAKTKAPIDGAMSCRMCKRMIINSGISRVVIRDGKSGVISVDVGKDWVRNNMGELQLKGGKYVPVKQSGY
jgi:dCMP deaminase